jgi:hypothetical protein
MIGYIDTPNASDAHPQWQTYKRIMAGNPTANTKREVSKSAKGISKSQPRMNAEAFLDSLVAQYFGETIASKEGANEDGTIKTVKILPYETPLQLYEVCSLQSWYDIKNVYN